MATQLTIDWQEILLDMIPLLLGMVITKRLNLQGWHAIVSYILVTGTVREVMGQLSPELANLKLLTGGSLKGVDVNGHRHALSATPPQSLTFGDHQVIHASPGRLRLRLPALAQHPECADQLQQHLASDERLQSVRVNPHAASVTVKYPIERFLEAEVLACLEELLVFAPEWIV